MCDILCGMSTTTTHRVLTLLGLLQAQPAWTGGELSERLNVTVRTIRNDVERLRQLGYPVEAQGGVGGGYRLGAGATLPPLLLDDEEAVALAVSLRTAAGAGIGGVEESALRALGKLDQVLPVRLRRRVSALSESIATAGHTGAVAIDADLLVTISAASRDHETLRFRYRTHAGDAQQRNVEPHHLVHLGRFWYLVAWDRERDAWRSFRLDRFEGKPRTDRRFAPRPAPAGGFGAYVSRSRSVARDRWQAEVVLHGPLSELRQKIPPRYGTLEELQPDRCLLRAGADWLGALAVSRPVEMCATSAG